MVVVYKALAGFHNGHFSASQLRDGGAYLLSVAILPLSVTLRQKIRKQDSDTVTININIAVSTKVSETLHR